jgi:hypothetical protein
MIAEGDRRHALLSSALGYSRLRYNPREFVESHLFSMYFDDTALTLSVSRTNCYVRNQRWIFESFEMMLEVHGDPTCATGVAPPDDLGAWLTNARPGDRFVYHHGFLVVDRAVNSPLRARDRRRLDVLAKAALGAASAGVVHLLQQRLDAGTFDYIAVKARPDLAARGSS